MRRQRSQTKIVFPRYLPPARFLSLNICSILAEKSENVELKFDGSLLEDVFDKFGEEIDILKSGENEYRTTVRIRADSAFFAWVVSSRGKVTVEAPSAVKERFDEFVQEIKKQY